MEKKYEKTMNSSFVYPSVPCFLGGTKFCSTYSLQASIALNKTMLQIICFSMLGPFYQSSACVIIGLSTRVSSLHWQQFVNRHKPKSKIPVLWFRSFKRVLGLILTGNNIRTLIIKYFVIEKCLVVAFGDYLYRLLANLWYMVFTIWLQPVLT